MRTIIIVAVLLSGCLGTARSLRPEPELDHHGMMAMRPGLVTYTDAQCRHALASENIFGSLAAGFGITAGGGGLSTAFPSDQTSREVLGVISLGAGVLGAVFTYLTSQISNQFTTFCTTAPASSGTP